MFDRLLNSGSAGLINTLASSKDTNNFAVRLTDGDPSGETARVTPEETASSINLNPDKKDASNLVVLTQVIAAGIYQNLPADARPEYYGPNGERLGGGTEAEGALRDSGGNTEGQLKDYIQNAAQIEARANVKKLPIVKAPGTESEDQDSQPRRNTTSYGYGGIAPPFSESFRRLR